MKQHSMNQADALQYVFGGKALFTVQNEKTGNRFTFQVKEKKNANFSLYFVSVLNGQDNDSNYLYIGSIINKRFNLTKGSKVSVEAQSFKVFEYVLFHLVNQSLPESIKVYHHGNCSKCGRTLTDPESIKSGMGPHCSSMISKSKQPQLF